VTSTIDARKSQSFDLARAALGVDPSIAWFIPGRIEFLGKHTDYAGGRSLLCAVDQGFSMVARPRKDRLVTIKLSDGRSAEFSLSKTLEPVAGSWMNYPMTVARRVAANFSGRLRGIDMAFASDLPPAAGMSSSSALVVGTFMLLSDANDLPSRPEYHQSITSPEALCGYLGTVENGRAFAMLQGNSGVGTFGGSEDHTAIVMSRAGHLSQFSFNPVRRESVHELPEGFEFVIAASGVVAEKTREAKEKYNRVSRTVAVMLEQWHAAGGIPSACLADAVRSSPDAIERFRAILERANANDFSSSELIARLDQFVGESEEIIPQAAAAIEEKQLRTLGELVDRSQAGAEAALGNQLPETIELAASARQLGAVAATAFGAGFGGSVWALVDSDRCEAFKAEWSARYADAFPAAAKNAHFFRTTAGPAATRII
jgi:galactokinase